MKRQWWQFCSVMLVLAMTVGAGLLAQTKGLAGGDGGRLDREISIMKSIFEKTIQIALSAESDQALSRRNEWRLQSLMESGIGTYYLNGQGVVFEVSLPAVGLRHSDSLEHVYSVLQEVESGRMKGEFAEAQLQAMKAHMEMARQEEEYAVLAELNEDPATAPVADAVPEKGEEAGAKPAPEPDPRVRERVQEKVRVLKADLEEARKRSAELAEKAKARQERIVNDLIGAVAVHGDSMTQIPSDQYINIVIRGEGGFPEVRFRDSSDSQKGRTILSVKKSDILAYKSGALTLDAFRARVLP